MNEPEVKGTNLSKVKYCDNPREKVQTKFGIFIEKSVLTGFDN